MKKFVKVFAILLLTPLLFLSGCLSLTFYDENDNSTGYSNISGFKLCYKDNNYQLDNTYEIYAIHLLTEIYANFGIVNDSVHTSKLQNKPTASLSKNYDRIRVQTQNDNTTTANSWKWTFSSTLSGAESLTTDTTDAENYYFSTARQNIYYNEFISTYKTALEIVLIQISMATTPTVFTITVDGDTKVFFDSAKTKEITAENQTVLADIKTEFASKGKYVGLTTENVATLKDYLLVNVIGENITNGHNTILFNGSTKTYSQVLDDILTTDATELNKSIFSPYPTAIAQDITNTSLYVSKDSSNPLGHITAREYQSFVIMPSSQTTFYSLSLAIESTYAMQVSVDVSYYDNAKNTRTSCLAKPYLINVSAGTWSASNLPYLTFYNAVVPAFNNTNLNFGSGQTINNANGNNIYYGINNNDIGVLDGENVGQSYFEVSLSITKNLNKDYYPFKIAIQSLW